MVSVLGFQEASCSLLDLNQEKLNMVDSGVFFENVWNRSIARKRTENRNRRGTGNRDEDEMKL